MKRAGGHEGRKLGGASRVLVYVGLITVAALYLAPLIWMASTAAIAFSSLRPISHHWLRGISPRIESSISVPLRAPFGPLATSWPIRLSLRRP